jgi:hypothetical protein
MAGWGFTLIVLGAASIIMPLWGKYPLILSWTGPARPYIAGAMIVAGAVLVVLGLKRKNPAPPPAPPSPPA